MSHASRRRILKAGSILIVTALAFSAPGCGPAPSGKAAARIKFAVSFPAERSAAPLDGRLLLMLSNDGAAEPRFQISDGAAHPASSSASTWTAWRPGREPSSTRRPSATRCGACPIVPPGEYFVQALLNRYETFHPRRRPRRQAAAGQGRRPALERQAGKSLQRAGRNQVIEPGDGRTIRISLDKEIPPIPAPAGHEIHQARQDPERAPDEVLGPADGDRRLRPPARGIRRTSRGPLSAHRLSTAISLIRSRASGDEPPDPDLKPDYSERFRIPGYNRIEQEYAHQFYKDWTGPGFPAGHPDRNPARQSLLRRLLRRQLGQPRPLRRRHRPGAHPRTSRRGSAASGKGWARFMYGGSTGGWEALAAQVFYPDDFNGCYAACPDPIDFRAYTVVDIYRHKNAYYVDGPWKKTPRPGLRNYLGEVATTLEQANHRELGHRLQGPVGRPVGHLAGGLQPGRRGRLSQADLGQADRGHRSGRRRVLEGELRPRAISSSATGRRSGPSSRARSTSTSATWTIIT